MKRLGFTLTRHSADSLSESSRICNQRMRSCSLANARSRMTGFTLIELSIVLVIIGLIVGGVLVGQDLIKAAELRATTSQFTGFQTAMNTYRLKYNAPPGDHKNAYDFFGAGCGTNADVNASAAGCNGNGNKQMNIFAEGFRAWQHLSLAKLIEGSYTGTHTGDEGVIGTNVPPADVKGGGFSIVYVSPSVFLGWSAPTAFNNYIYLGAFRTSEVPVTQVLTPLEAYKIDTKLDDGLPTTGKLIGGNGWPSGSGCLTGAAYDLDADNTKRCTIAFELGRL